MPANKRVTGRDRFPLCRLLVPGKNRGRPHLTVMIARHIWQESRYRCAICRSPGVEIHHIVPWREALGKFGDPHPAMDLISLCPACHAKADEEDIARRELAEIKAKLSQRGTERRIDIPPDWLENLSLDERGFLSHLRDWHRRFIY